MKKTYQIPSVEMAQMKASSFLLASPPSGVPFNPNPGSGVDGD